MSKVHRYLYIFRKDRDSKKYSRSRKKSFAARKFPLFTFSVWKCKQWGVQSISIKRSKIMSSNLRPTTRECVHSVTPGNSWSRDKNDDHTIRSAIAKTTCCTQTSRLYVLQKRSYCRSKFSIAGIWIFDLFRSCDLDLDSMTFIYKLHPYLIDP